MSDFLDNLIDRHINAAPQIKPRLHAIFEAEVFHGGLDVTVPDNIAAGMEEADVLPSARISIPIASPTVGEPMQPKAARPNCPCQGGATFR